jgi:L-arabinokinase
MITVLNAERTTLKKYVESSAPGRLDVMGGIADYSGSLVLQMPLSQKTSIKLTLRDDYTCVVLSKISTGELFTVKVDYRDYLINNQVDYEFAQKKFKQKPDEAWIAYVLGCALVLQKEKGIDFKGAEFNLQSTIPLGKGVSSSASIEVTTMKALGESFGVAFAGTELPVLAQRVENLVVGAPCGLMDQLACYLGEANKLLPIICQPDLVQKSISIPSDISFIGIDSGVRHSVSGASYTDVRCAAFMGYTIIAHAFGVSLKELATAKVEYNFSSLPFAGYLCNIPVTEFENSIVHHLPVSLSGKDFLNQFELSIDRVTQINPDKIYYIKQSVAHPVYENSRVSQFKNLLLKVKESSASTERTSLLTEMGTLMFQAHESYSQCGLGSDRTDEIVSLSRNKKGIYGAKITGGGNGGTVCLLVDEAGRISARHLHQQLCDKYNQDLIWFE